MTKLPDGLYDLVVTQAVAQELSQLGTDRRAEVETLQAADSHLLLVRHVAAIVRKALRAIPEDERAARQWLPVDSSQNRRAASAAAPLTATRRC